MSGNGKVEAAVAAVAASEKVTEVHKQHQVTIASTGRHFMFSRPTDMSTDELFEVVGWMSQNLRIELMAEEQRRAVGGLALPDGSRIPVRKS